MNINPWAVGAKTALGVIVGAAAAAFAQSVQSGRPITEAKGAAVAGALVAAAGLFTPQPNK